MIKAIYFYDGPCYMAVGKLPIPNNEKFQVLDAGMGTTYNIEQLRVFSVDHELNILTNNPELLSFDLCDNFYLFDFREQKYKHITELTEKELRPEHDLRKLWIGGTFPNTKMIFEKPLS